MLAVVVSDTTCAKSGSVVGALTGLCTCHIRRLMASIGGSRLRRGGMLAGNRLAGSRLARRSMSRLGHLVSRLC